jgi:hypothetical protein
MKKSDYEIIDLDSSMNDLKEMLIKEHQKYSKRIVSGCEWTGDDFANLYFSNLTLLEIVKKQDKMIKNIYEILDRHEGGLG